MKKLSILILLIGIGLHAKDLSWTVPEGWVDLNVSNSMRLATLAPKDNKALQVKISKFPGNVGGELANVNRWRGQIGLGAIKEADLNKSLEVIDTKAGKAKLLDITNGGKQMLAVMLPHKGSTYFFKLMGNADDVKKQKDAMTTFIKSIK